MTNSRHAAAALSIAASLGLVACGGEGKQAPATAASPGEARAGAGATRAALRKALAQLKAGERKTAENTVAEGYLRHFEDVEGPLEKVDHDLKERLEKAIATTLRARIRSGAPIAEVERLVRRTDADLARAERKLK